MKKTLIAMISLLALGLAGCDSGTPCDEAADVAMAGIREACEGRTDCLLCECTLNGQSVNSTGDGCVDPPDPGEPAACEGSALDNANDCLDNRTECQAAARTAFETALEFACPAD